MLEVNPDVYEVAAALDEERAVGSVRGPLHGVPVFVKDNIDTADGMQTTAGSLALAGYYAPEDATVAARLREAGAILLGKTNLSEWANFRSTQSSSGWSSRGGQALNPYALDRSTCGSSSGSAAAVAANLCAAALGTETDGSVVCPSSACSIVGIKPTVGLASRAGVIPISRTQDTVGPMARTVADAAVLLGAIAGPDTRDPATRDSKAEADYTRFLDPDGLRGARIGVARDTYFGYSDEADALAEAAIEEMRALGAEVEDPADISTAADLMEGTAELEVLLYEFKAGINEYLATRPDLPTRTLEDLIAFNEENRDAIMPYFGQEIFEQAQAKGDLNEDAYKKALRDSQRLGREGLDRVLDEFGLDAVVMPTNGPPFGIDLLNGDGQVMGSSAPAATSGYPAITVPIGYSFGLPVGLTFVGRAYSEPTLIKLAYAYEQATLHRQSPQFLPTADLGAPSVPLPETGGMPLVRRGLSRPI